ncbi:MAG: DUF1273 family protein [Ruminiclostridium sp.]|nr:DUF1273 family protein [Ruminiclostridium sp.]
MKEEVICAVLSVPVEKLPHKFNEVEESVIFMKTKLASIFQQAAADTELTVMTNGEFGVPLWCLEIARTSIGLGHSIKTAIVVPCDEQDECWAEEWRDRYYTAIEYASCAPALPPEYIEICRTTEDYYDFADRYMIDSSDFVIAVTAGGDEPDGVEYARRKGKQIVYFDAETLKIT